MSDRTYVLAAARRFSRQVTDLAAWVSTRLDEHLWTKQREVAESVTAHRRTAVQSCHGVGKSYLASRTVAWWLDTHPPGEAFAVTTAPTFSQVRGVLWREIGKAHRKGRLIGRVNQTEWLIGDELVAFGRKPADTDPTAFQGIHARYVLVVLDEACGIPKDLWIAAGALATNADCRILAIGNPDDPGSYFAEVCKPGSGWNVLQISAFDSPNFTGEPIPAALRPLLVGPEWVDEMRRDVGEGSPVWIAKVEGRFPVDADDQVVRYAAVSACQRLPEDPAAVDVPVVLGVDVGAGGDMTVVRERRGNRAGRVWRKSTPDSPEAVDLVLRAIAETGATAVHIDSIGVGWGVAGSLQEKRSQGVHGARVVKVNVGTTARDSKRFPKLRDELWWTVGRQLSEDRAWDLSGLDDQTVSQLCAPKYGIDVSGRIKVEPKEDTIKRIGRSPDDADALLLAFYSPTGTLEDFLTAYARTCPGCGYSNPRAAKVCGSCKAPLTDERR